MLASNFFGRNSCQKEERIEPPMCYLPLYESGLILRTIRAHFAIAKPCVNSGELILLNIMMDLWHAMGA
jgi:hypothetical protein